MYVPPWGDNPRSPEDHARDLSRGSRGGSARVARTAPPGLAEASKGVVDLLTGGAALFDEVVRVLPMKRPALLQAREDGVVHVTCLP